MGAGLPSKPTVRGIVCALLSSTSAVGQLNPVGPDEVCADFSTGRYPGLAWTFDDCIGVWTHFESTVGYKPNHPEVDLWRDTASELRRQGTPCLLGSVTGGDGLGSTTIRHVATWILAEEMGCDWLTPDWGKKKARDGDGEAVRYCHAVVPRDERELPTQEGGMKGTARCTVVDWLSYFQFDKPSVSSPSSGSIKTVSQQPAQASLVDGIISAKEDLELERTGSARRNWNHILFRTGLATGSQHALNPRTWNDSKRSIARNILARMRENFHRHPREWYDETPHCRYDPNRLHFAMHVRMGDRHKFTDMHPEYFERLEEVMSTVSQEVTRRGLAEPMFHIFSETVMPCPSEKKGLFHEFPTWPVAADEVAACRAAVEHDGIFHVQGKTIMLHFDRDVQNAMSCMIQADGIMMGCSTFGQIGGLFSKGISMFSTQCGGERTPPQYRIIPPLAVSERGHLWVPVVGSWFDPVLEATDIFRNALDVLLDNKGITSRTW
ncbi:unnamed protein product [Scytosiphon promiscuus]